MPYEFYSKGSEYNSTFTEHSVYSNAYNRRVQMKMRDEEDVSVILDNANKGT